MSTAPRYRKARLKKSRLRYANDKNFGVGVAKCLEKKDLELSRVRERKQSSTNCAVTNAKP